MEKKQRDSAATRNAAPTRAEIKNRIIKEFFVSLFAALVPKGGSGKKKTTTTKTEKKKKKSGSSGRSKGGGSRAVATAAFTPVSSGYASEEKSDV